MGIFVGIYLVIGVIIAWIAMEIGNIEAKQKGMTFTEMHYKSMRDINKDIGAEEEKTTSFPGPWAVLLAVTLLWIVLIPPTIIRYMKNK